MTSQTASRHAQNSKGSSSNKVDSYDSENGGFASN